MALVRFRKTPRGLRIHSIETRQRPERNQVKNEQLLNEIREANLSYLMLAHRSEWQQEGLKTKAFSLQEDEPTQWTEWLDPRH